jgi:hypothetical protein
LITGRSLAFGCSTSGPRPSRPPGWGSKDSRFARKQRCRFHAKQKQATMPWPTRSRLTATIVAVPIADTTHRLMRGSQPMSRVRGRSGPCVVVSRSAVLPGPQRPRFLRPVRAGWWELAPGGEAAPGDARGLAR